MSRAVGQFLLLLRLQTTGDACTATFLEVSLQGPLRGCLEQLKDWLGHPHRDGRSLSGSQSACLVEQWETRQKYPKWAPQVDYEWPSHWPVHGAVPIHSLTKAEPCCGRATPYSPPSAEGTGWKALPRPKAMASCDGLHLASQPQDGEDTKSGVKSQGAWVGEKPH